jgi:hypothetical protein
MKERQPFTVVVTEKHCEGHYCHNYLNTQDCPLFRAIKEQYPDFPLIAVGGKSLLHTGDDTRPGNAWQYGFDQKQGEAGWNYSVAKRIAMGALKSFTVTISPKEIRHAIDLHS